MQVKQYSNWKLELMYGDEINKEVKVAFVDMNTGQYVQFSVQLSDAQDFYENLGRRIQQAQTGEYNG